MPNLSISPASTVKSGQDSLVQTVGLGSQQIMASRDPAMLPSQLNTIEQGNNGTVTTGGHFVEQLNDLNGVIFKLRQMPASQRQSVVDEINQNVGRLSIAVVDGVSATSTVYLKNLKDTVTLFNAAQLETGVIPLTQRQSSPVDTAVPAELRPNLDKSSPAVVNPAPQDQSLLVPTAQQVAAKCLTATDVKISYGPNANEAAMTPKALEVLKEVSFKAGLSSVQVTSTARDVNDQARIMYDMIKSKGVDYVNKLYSAGGETIVSVYVESVKNKLSPVDTKRAMADKMEEIGPSTVSHHIVSADGKLTVFDVAPSSVGDSEARKRFVQEAKAQSNVAKFLEPLKDPAYHFEVTN